MRPNNSLKDYIRIMNGMDIDNAVKLQIIKNCARHSTLHKIKLGKFKIIVVKKDETADEI